MSPALSRRKFLATSGAAVAGATMLRMPYVRAATKITIGVLDSFVEPMKTVLTQLQFTQKTGIEVEVGTRARTADDFTTQMAGAIQSGKTPFDVIDFEDEIASVFPKAGWLLPLNDLMTPEVTADFPQSMLDVAAIWDTLNGEQFRIHHNYEAQYYWYRKDVFDAKGVAVPKTWDDVRALGAVLTDEANGGLCLGRRSDEGRVPQRLPRLSHPARPAAIPTRSTTNTRRPAVPLRPASQGQGLYAGSLAEGIRRDQPGIHQRPDLLHAPVALLLRRGARRRTTGTRKARPRSRCRHRDPAAPRTAPTAQAGVGASRRRRRTKTRRSNLSSS